MEPDVSTWESLQRLLEEDIIWQKQELQRWETVTGDHAAFERDVGQYQMSLLQTYLQLTLCAQVSPALRQLPVRFGHMAIGIANPVQANYPLATVEVVENDLLNLYRLHVEPKLADGTVWRPVKQKPEDYVDFVLLPGDKIVQGTIAQVCHALEELVQQSGKIADDINRAVVELLPKAAALHKQEHSDPFEE